MSKARVKKGDMVVVISGKDRDLTQPRRVLEVDRRGDRVLVEGAGVIKRHTKPNPQKNIKGGIVERESPIHVSNVMLVDPDSKKPSRVGIQGDDRKSRVRVARVSGKPIDK
ncbi:MAG: 50S ribosomal protein L24 [Acidobacteria bacterium]|nr:50S ribosomal protein L24 [Acidobacteriota bacterium]NIM60807.1 50S ribosomal protein L24 [Acidobacteriota bacterium]NIQ83492.1 50S ribosomal protein L24 [Acidobacteriota bacterium]NIT09733.1 50S ribosomal protein L24 [Acidobacteriota bacterium]